MNWIFGFSAFVGGMSSVVCYWNDSQVEIVKSMKEMEKLAEELIDVEIPEYKVSDNHIKLVDKGIQ